MKLRGRYIFLSVYRDEYVLLPDAVRPSVLEELLGAGIGVYVAMLAEREEDAAHGSVGGWR